MEKSIGNANAVIHTRGYTYAQGLDALDILIGEVRENKGDCDHVLYGWKLSTKYIKADNYLSTDHQFAKSVYKIHSGIGKTMSPSEKKAYGRLLNTENNGQSSVARWH